MIFIVFAIRVYLKYWFTSRKAAEAPRHDLQFLKSIQEFAEIDKSISEKALAKFQRHLWYLSEMLIGLSIFDDGVEMDIKRKMLEKMKSSEMNAEKSARKAFIHPALIKDAKLIDFVTPNTMKFFLKMFPTDMVPNEIKLDFLKTDPDSWENDDNYLLAKSVVHSLHVVNDIAERGVATMTSYNSTITKSEEDKQNLLQSVEKHRINLPKLNKKDIKQYYKK